MSRNPSIKDKIQRDIEENFALTNSDYFDESDFNNNNNIHGQIIHHQQQREVNNTDDIKLEDIQDETDFFSLGFKEMLTKLCEIYSFSFPMITSYLFTLFFLNLINIKFIKELNNDVITAALGIGITFANFIAIGFILGFNQGLNTLAAQAYGSKNFALVGIYYHRGLILVNFLVLILSIFFLFSDYILIAMGVDEQIAHMTRIYTIYIIPAMFGFACFDCSRVYLSVHGTIIAPIIVQLITGALQILFSHLLIQEAQLGLEGAAIARCITEWLNFIFLLVYMKFTKSTNQTNTPFLFNHFKLAELWDFTKFSLIMGSIVFFDWVAFELLTVISGHFGPNEIVAQVTVVYVSITDFIFSCGISTAVMSFVANSLGASTKNRGKNYLIAGCVAEIIFLILFGTIIFIFRYQWAHLFSNYSATIGFSVQCLDIYLVSTMAFEGLQLILSGALRGMGKEIIASVAVTVCVYGISLPAVFIFAFGYNLQVEGIWWGFSIGIWILSIFFIYELIVADWQNQIDTIAKKILSDSQKLDNSA